MNASWTQKITPTSVILTPNSRLARFLQRQLQTESTDIVSPSHTILPLQSWLHNYYRNTLLTQEIPLTLLTPNQEVQIWQRIINQSSWGDTLLQIPATAKSAQQAYQTLAAWNLSISDLASEENSETSVFIDWATTFEAYCQEHKLLQNAKLHNYIVDIIRNDQSQLPEHILLFSFDELTPQLHWFLENLTLLSAKLEYVEEALDNQTCQQVVCHDLENEIFTMARWAKQCLQQNPSATITCVIPNLADIRSQIKTIFTHLFFPEALFKANFTQEIVNISGGYALSEATIISAALHILNYNLHTIEIDQLTHLLTMPFLQGFTTESQQRAYIDVQLRNCNEPTLKWKFVQNLLADQNTTPILIKNITTWLDIYKKLPKQQTLTAWQTCFYQLLHALGWPGDRTLNSREYQQINRWYELLHELPLLDIEQKSYTYSEALTLLQQLTRNTLFEIESHDGPVQVLGLLEAADSVSDYLWVMHLDDETFPQAANPNPFLPYHLQQQQQMPHSSAQRELQFSEQMLQRFYQSAIHIIFSHHQYDNDRQLSISPLLNNIPKVSAAALPLSPYQSLSKSIQAEIKYEYYVDNRAPCIQKNEKISGGTGILKQQASCPFRAFAQYRLHAESLAIPEVGLNALERGSLLHICLDRIWKKLKNHTTLQQQSTTALKTLVGNAIERSLQDFFSEHTQKIKPRFKHLEQQRLQTLLLTWLALEKERPPFQVIAHEQWRQLQIGELKINMQIDRIDTLASGEKIVIDYKTGVVNPTSWFGTRPREPQLPLYTLNETDIMGISFAQVRVDAMAFKGIAANETNVDGIKTLAAYKAYDIPDSWNTLVNEWQTTLQQLAIDFTQGEADVDPAYYDSCNHCDLHSLCRIN